MITQERRKSSRCQERLKLTRHRLMCEDGQRQEDQEDHPDHPDHPDNRPHNSRPQGFPVSDSKAR